MRTGRQAGTRACIGVKVRATMWAGLAVVDGDATTKQMPTDDCRGHYGTALTS